MKILTEEYYGHILQVTFGTVSDEATLEFIPDSVKEIIFNNLADDSDSGGFTEEETGDGYSGTWKIQPLNFQLMLRIANWDYNCVRATEGLTLELFQESYGKVIGAHYYGKWREFKLNFFKMIRYFSQYMDAGQTFCNMVIKQVEKYENKRLYHQISVHEIIKDVQ